MRKQHLVFIGWLSGLSDWPFGLLAGPQPRLALRPSWPSGLTGPQAWLAFRLALRPGWTSSRAGWRPGLGWDDACLSGCAALDLGF